MIAQTLRACHIQGLAAGVPAGSDEASPTNRRRERPTPRQLYGLHDAGCAARSYWACRQFRSSATAPADRTGAIASSPLGSSGLERSWRVLSWQRIRAGPGGPVKPKRSPRRRRWDNKRDRQTTTDRASMRPRDSSEGALLLDAWSSRVRRRGRFDGPSAPLPLAVTPMLLGDCTTLRRHRHRPRALLLPDRLGRLLTGPLESCQLAPRVANVLRAFAAGRRPIRKSCWCCRIGDEPEVRETGRGRLLTLGSSGGDRLGDRDGSSAFVANQQPDDLRKQQRGV